MSREPVLRIGVVGLGFASTVMLPELSAHPRVKITAGADIRPEAAEAFGSQFRAETYRSAEDLCASPNVDAVYILTPNRFTRSTQSSPRKLASRSSPISRWRSVWTIAIA